jgi:bifunctional non-homologous end joining protein LigD
MVEPVTDLVDPALRDRLGPGAPEFVPPMLATLTDQYFSDPAWLFERKLDGVRAVVVCGDSPAHARTRLYSRNQKPIGGTYPELVEALDRLAPRAMVADGEIVAFDGNQTSFARLQARLGITDPRRARATGVDVYLYLFDLLVLDGSDLTRLPLRERKRMLRMVMTFRDPVRYSDHQYTEGERLLRKACEWGWEGLIAKRAEAPYRPGRRSEDWLKFKCLREQELVVGGFTDPSGARVGFGALLLGYYDGGRLRYAGKVGTGFDEQTLRALRRRFEELTCARPPFAEPVRERGAHWLRPEIVAQIGFTEWTRDGRLRHPRFLGLREDKPADEVVREAPKS